MTSPASLVIRRANREDAAALTEVAHRAKAHWGYPADWMTRWQTDLTLTPEYISAHRAFVGEASGCPVATCVLEDRRTSWSIEHLWVVPEYQGSGFGRAILEHVRQVAHDVRPDPIEVISDPNAEPFYRKLGAVPVGSEPAPMPGAPARVLPKLRFLTG
jgi:GNAT superfamily N-acetyltransferase